MRALVAAVALAILAVPAGSETLAPLRFGMSGADIRAARPDIVWTEDRGCAGCDLYQLKGASYAAIADLLFDAALNVSHKAGLLNIDLTHRDGDIGRDRCDARGYSLAADLETRYGPLYWDAAPLPGKEIVVAAGQHSRVMMSSWPKGYAMRAKAKFTQDGATVVMLMQIDLNKSSCDIVLTFNEAG